MPNFSCLAQVKKTYSSSLLKYSFHSSGVFDKKITNPKEVIKNAAIMLIFLFYLLIMFVEQVSYSLTTMLIFIAPNPYNVTLW